MRSAPGKPSKVNISTIARLAETSIMTVSRVLNNKPDVSDETREKILAIMRQQGYKPHAAARKLSGGRTRIIGVALYTGGSPVVGLYVEVLQGLQAGLAESDYDLLLFAPSKTDRYGDRVIETTVLDGLVLMGNWTSENDILHLRDSDVPFLTIGRRTVEGYTAPFISPDYEKSMNEIVDYAASNGARRISVVLSGLDHEKQKTSAAIQEKIAGIESARKFHGLPDDAVSLVVGTWQFADGYNLFYNASTLPDAVVLDSTEFSFGVAMALRDRKLRIHDDIQLLGVDYENQVLRRCEDVLGIPIPHWTVPWFDVGTKAAQHIVKFVSDQTADFQEYVNFQQRNLYVL